MTASVSASLPLEKKTRILYFDLLRAFACLSVVMIHVSIGYARAEVGSVDFWIGNLFDSVSRAGVPIFVMISGALMLDEEYRFTKEKWRRHMGKMLLFFLFWSVSYALLYTVGKALLRREALDVLSVVEAILAGHFHLWFVPMILGLYLIVPLLRLWVRKQYRRHVEYFLLLALVFSFIIPQGVQLLICTNSGLGFMQGVVDNVHMKYAVGYTAYFVLGWYLHNFGLSHRTLVYGLGIAGVCITFLGTYAVFTYTNSDKFLFYDNFSVNVLMYSTAVFVQMKSRYANRLYEPLFTHRAINLISRCSLGVYAVHVAVLSVASHFLSQLHVLFAVPITFGVCTVVSVAVSFAMGKIPFVREVV